MDLTWEGFGPAVAEPNQFIRARRTGHVRHPAPGPDGLVERHPHRRRPRPERSTPATTWGSRDRSWGVRPVGEKEPDGIRQGAHAMGGGMWSYFPMRFEDHSIFYICSERADGVPHARAGRAGLARRPDRAARPHRARTTSSMPGIRLLDRLDDQLPRRRLRDPLHAAAAQLPRRRHRLRPRAGLAPRHVPGARDRSTQGIVYEVPEIQPARRLRRRRPRRPLRATTATSATASTSTPSAAPCRKLRPGVSA